MLKNSGKRGFASMKDKDLQKDIASRGGTSISADRLHMAEIGRIGGIRSGEARRRKKDKAV